MVEQPSQKKLVLVLEDQGYVIEAVYSALSRFPRLGMLHASDVQSAKKLLEEQKPDLIIQDIYLPGISGLELLHTAKQKNPKVCVIVICSASDEKLARQAVSEGAWDFVIRPAQLDKIQNMVELWLMLNPCSP